MPRSSLTDLTAADAVRHMVAGDFMAEAYTTACLDAMDGREAEIEAWVVYDRAHALEQARDLDKARAGGQRPGSLHGLPVGIKDVIDTADLPTQNGSAIYKNHQPATDACCVAQIRGAGGVIIGKTVTTELANTLPSKSRNPHNAGHTPGGSSSGSAAAVGARTIPLALGTQTGGSVIRPGSFCGTYAMKPTLGLISRTGVTLQSHSLDTVGVFGRSLADLALLTDAIAAHDPADSVSYLRGRLNLTQALTEAPTTKPRFAFLKSPAWPYAEPAAQAALTAFVAGLGSCVEEIEIAAMNGIIAHHANVMGAENVAYYGPLRDAHPGGLSASLTQRLADSEKVAAGDYIRSVNAREGIYAEVARQLDTYAALITLPACGPAPKGMETTGNPVFNAMWTYLGVPCVTLPLLSVDGMPLGVQLIGARRNEGRLLAAANWLERQVR